jgi:hypothetical protein
MRQRDRDLPPLTITEESEDISREKRKVGTAFSDLENEITGGATLDKLNRATKRIILTIHTNSQR